MGIKNLTLTAASINVSMKMKFIAHGIDLFNDAVLQQLRTNIKGIRMPMLVALSKTGQLKKALEIIGNDYSNSYVGWMFKELSKENLTFLSEAASDVTKPQGLHAAKILEYIANDEFELNDIKLAEALETINNNVVDENNKVVDLWR